MNTQQEYSPSVFAEMVDKLRNKSEEELKMLYLQLFANDLANEWQDITNNTDFSGVSDEELVQAIKKNRYSN